MVFRILLEGCDGTYKTTTSRELAKRLEAVGGPTLLTKEPGSPHQPVTMELRRLMLDSRFDDASARDELVQSLDTIISRYQPYAESEVNELTPVAFRFLSEAKRSIQDAGYGCGITKVAREFISSAIRSVHMQKLLLDPATIKRHEYVVQDRGVLSGLAYGDACGLPRDLLISLATEAIGAPFTFYDLVVYLKRKDSRVGLETALACKQEFSQADAMESRGANFMALVSARMDMYAALFSRLTIVYVEGKTSDEIVGEILALMPLQARAIQ